MIMALPVLPLLSTLALSGYVTIDGVAADASNHKVTVAVTTSAAVGDEDVRAKLADGKLQLYLDAGHVRTDRRAFHSGGLAISVLKRSDYAKVEIPLGAELGCTGPITTEAGEKGFRASIRCQGAAEAMPAEAPVEKVAVAEKAEKPITATATATTTTTTANADPKAVEVKAVEAKAVEAKAVEVKAAAVKPMEVKAAVETKLPEAMKAGPIAAPAPVVAEPVRSSSSGMMMPAMGLIVMGGVAFFLKRRQGKKTSMIEILETAQLGPKRQLVVARVNGETMILGSSEAGITCLSGIHRLPSENTFSSFPQLQQAGQLTQSQMQLPARQQFHAFDAPAAPLAVASEFVDEGGLLTRLFRARGQDKPQEKFDNIELHEFDNLLQESVADQELRRKLSSGLRGKVS
jgi:flagellar biogenesis protein FliO